VPEDRHRVSGLPREESRGALEDVALLLQALDALAQLAQLLALGARQPIVALTRSRCSWRVQLRDDCADTPRRGGDVRDRAALTDQLDRLTP
jgi:hypothetical protein